MEETVTVLNFPGMIAKIHRPVLTGTERAARIKAITTAAAKLLKER